MTLFVLPPRIHRLRRWQKALGALIMPLALLSPAGAGATDTDLGAGAPLSTQRRAELVTLVRQDCGSCHGLTLQGGLGPALLPAPLQDKPAVYLKTVILHGLPDTAMPPWQRFLTDTEADWIVTHLKKGFPSER